MSEIQPRPYSKDYEITDAMFGAFRSPGGPKYFWKLFGWTTLLFSLIYLVAFPPLLRGYLRFFNIAFELEEGVGDAEAAEQALEGIGASLLTMVPSFLVLMFGSLLIISIVRAAFYRRYFHQEVDGVFPFRLGADEWRQFGVQLGYWGLFTLFFCGILLVIVLLGVVLGGLSAAIGSGSAAMVVGILIVILIYVAIFVGAFWFGVTFAPAGALTGLRQKAHILAARKITKNRYWALLGSLLVAFLISYIMSYVMSSLGMTTGLAGLFSGGGLTDIMLGENTEDARESLANISESSGFRIGAFFAIIMTAAGQAFYILMMMGPSAFFVRQWNEADPVAVFE